MVSWIFIKEINSKRELVSHFSQESELKDLPEASYLDNLDTVGPTLNALNYAPASVEKHFRKEWLNIAWVLKGVPRSYGIKIIQDQIKKKARKVSPRFQAVSQSTDTEATENDANQKIKRYIV